MEIRSKEDLIAFIEEEIYMYQRQHTRAESRMKYLNIVLDDVKKNGLDSELINNSSRVKAMVQGIDIDFLIKNAEKTQGNKDG